MFKKLNRIAFAASVVLAMALWTQSGQAAVIHNLPKVTPATEANELQQVETALVRMDLITLGRVDASNVGLGSKASDSGIGLELDFIFDLAQFDGGEPVKVGGDVAGSAYKLTAVLLVDGSVSSLWYDDDFDNMFVLEKGKKTKAISHVSYYGVLTTMPLPAAAWMLIAALGGLGLVRGCKRNAA